MLLILAGVSISLVVGDNGVLTQAKGSSDATKLAQAKEALGLAIEDCQTEYFDEYRKNASAKITDYITPGKVEKALENQGYHIRLVASGSTTVPAPDKKPAAVELNATGDGSTGGAFNNDVYIISASDKTATTVTDYVPFIMEVKATGVGAKVWYGEFNKLTASTN